jgi:hypothetical protein
VRRCCEGAWYSRDRIKQSEVFRFHIERVSFDHLLIWIAWWFLGSHKPLNEVPIFRWFAEEKQQ